MSRQPRLWTARYGNPTLAEHPAGKVGITLGAPRFRLPYELVDHVHQLAPAGWMLNKSEAEFADLYTQLLERRGVVEFFAERFADVARTAGVDQLVLCCYEDIRKPGVWCHRRVLAAWLEERTGQLVEELPDGPEQLAL